MSHETGTMKTLHDNNVITMDNQYNVYYDMLKDNLNLENGDVFYLTMLLGYTNNVSSSSPTTEAKKIESNKLIQVRTNYIRRYHPVMYAMMEEISGKQFLENFESEDKLSDYLKELVHYANGGLNLLIENVLNDYLSDSGRNYTKESDSFVEQVVQFFYDQVNTTEAPF